MEICASAYLSSINGMAGRIAADTQAIVASFEHLWNTMEPQERASTLTDAIIEPEVALRYLRGAPESSVAPCEALTDSRDEHGAPFFWHTRSQLDLVDLSKSVPCGALLQMSSKHPSLRHSSPPPTLNYPPPVATKISKPRAPPPPPPKRPTLPSNSPPTSTSAIIISSSQNSDTEVLVVSDNDEELDDRLPGHSPANEEKSLLCEYSKADYDFLNNW